MHATSTLPHRPDQRLSPAIFHAPNAALARKTHKIFGQALTHHLAGRLERALALYGDVLALNPDIADAHNNSGSALLALGRADDAAVRFRRALAISPNHPYAHFNLGNALTALGRYAEAAGHFRRAVALKPDYAEACNNLGHVLAALGDSDAAATQFKRSIALNPNQEGAHTNLGNLLRDRGQFADAMAHYDRAIAIRPSHAEAHYDRSEIRTFRPGDADLAALEVIVASRNLTPQQTPYAHFALAKALEDCRDYPRAFAQLRLGNVAKRRQIRYDEAAVEQQFSRIVQAFDRNLFERFRGIGNPTEVPVFVLGMPRSGSTLVEQILACHPQVHGAGEREDLRAASGAAFPESVTALTAASLRDMAKSYLSRLPAVSGDAVRVVDKLPANFLRIGLIHLLFPNARIIHTMRDPIDTCLSCYARLFTGGQHFSYDLGELGRYYRSYSRLMEHWRTVLPPGVMLEVAYEDVVNDLEGQARRLIDYCGLPWDDRCLNFHQNSRTIRTASAVQVRQPLFRSSLQRWRRFEADLGPLLSALGYNAGLSAAA